MHGNRGPCHRPAPPHFQILDHTERYALRVVQKFLLHTFVVFLPAVIGKWSDVIKNEPILLGIETRWSIRVARAPRGAVLVDEFAESGVIGGLLLSARSH